MSPIATGPTIGFALKCVLRIKKRISHPSPPCDKLRKIVKFNSEFERSHPPPWRSQDIDDDEEEEKETDAESSVLLEVNVAEARALQNRKIGRLKELRMFLLVLGEKDLIFKIIPELSKLQKYVLTHSKEM